MKPDENPMKIDRRSFLRSTTAALSAGVVGGCGSTSRGPDGNVIARGTVSAAEVPLEGVCVSDGLHVVATDSNGSFELPLESASGPFLFVRAPQGYWADRFWTPTQRAASGPVKFKLEPVDQKSRFRFVYLTDAHLGEGSDPKKLFGRLREALSDLATLSPPPDFVWFGGDMCVGSGWGSTFKKLMEGQGLPTRYCVGDHELRTNQYDPRADYGSFFGPTYYSFDWAGAHFVALDGCRVVRDGARLSVNGEFSPEELAWLEEDMAMVEPGTPTVVAVHMPLASTNAIRRSEGEVDAPGCVHRNPSAIFEILKGHDVPLVLQGHLHENERLVQGTTEFVVTVSVSGQWWTRDAWDVGVSGEPRGFRVVDVDGQKVEHTFVPIGEEAPVVGEIVGRPELLPRSEKVSLLLNVFDARSDAIVESRVGEGSWTRLAVARPEGTVKGLQMAHHWLLVLDTRSWELGEHRLEIQISDPGGQKRRLAHTIEVI